MFSHLPKEVHAEFFFFYQKTESQQTLLNIRKTWLGLGGDKLDEKAIEQNLEQNDDEWRENWTQSEVLEFPNCFIHVVSSHKFTFVFISLFSTFMEAVSN